MLWKEGTGDKLYRLAYICGFVYFLATMPTPLGCKQLIFKRL